MVIHRMERAGARDIMISIRYFSPAPELRAFLSSYYFFESNLPVFDDIMRAELPQIRVLTVGRGTNCFSTGTSRAPRSGAFLQGPTSGPVRFVAQGALHGFGVGLLPRGWASFIGESAAVLADDLVDLASVVGPCANSMIDQMRNAVDDEARVAVADRFFLGLLARAHATPLWFTQMTDAWLTASGDPVVDTLVAESGMSARSVERMAKQIYGASPKLLARKYRALGAAVRIGNGEAQGWGDLPAGSFYDQAHFIREFKQFTGMTPARFQAEAAPVTRITIARKKLLPGLPKLALFS